MSTCEQNSVISYQASVLSTDAADNTVYALSGIDTIENVAGMFRQDLSDYATFNVNSSTISFAVAVKIDTPDAADSSFTDTFTIALLGCNQASSSGDDLAHVDSLLSCSLETFDWFENDPESQTAVKVFNQTLYNFSGEEQQVVSGGAFNIIHHGFTDLYISSGTLLRTAVFTISGLTQDSFNVGYFFFGKDLPVQINPESFSWRARIQNTRQQSRSLSTFSSSGILVRSVNVDIVNVPLTRLFGQVVALSPDPEDDTSNWMRVIMANTGQPILFNPYPNPVLAASATNEQLMLALRQNFFSIYGFAAQDLNFSIGSMKEGVSAVYDMRMEFTEVR